MVWTFKMEIYSVLTCRHQILILLILSWQILRLSSNLYISLGLDQKFWYWIWVSIVKPIQDRNLFCLDMSTPNFDTVDSFSTSIDLNRHGHESCWSWLKFLCQYQFWSRSILSWHVDTKSRNSRFFLDQN